MCDLTCKHVDLLHLKSLCVLCLAVLLLIYLPGNTGKHIFRSDISENLGNDYWGSTFLLYHTKRMGK